MKKVNSFEYLFCGGDSVLLENIQRYLESKGIYPFYRQVRDENEFKKALDEKSWDIIFIDSESLEQDVEDFLKYKDDTTFLSFVLFVESIDVDKLVFLMKKGLDNVLLKGKIIEDLHNIVEGELQNIEIKRKVSQLRLLGENIKKYELIRRFSGNVSHRINNMLMVVLNTAAFIAEDRSLPSHLKEDVEQIVRISKKGQEFAHNLLKVASGAVLNPSVIEINSFLKSVANSIRNNIGNNLELNIKRVQTSGEIKVDQGLLTEAFGYLIQHLKNLMIGTGTIEIECEILNFEDGDEFLKMTGLKSGEYIQIAIGCRTKDVSSDEIARIFEPFYVDSELLRGEGLGLSLSFGIIWEHNGIIDIEGGKGKGTRFLVYLPLFKRDSKEILIPRSSGYFHVSKGTVLIVEDDEEVKNILIRIFGEEGYNVIDAADGLGALVLLQRLKPTDLSMLVTDVIMPKMGGLELAREVRKKYKDLKVVFISGFPDNDQEILRFENSIFIQKPVTKEILMNRIRYFISTTDK
ncbi:MAG: response regulator [Deltaproteobacteria bacterium]|nr:response regulator [Deltaproteobacteria bacterium]